MPSILHLEDDALDHKLIRAALVADGLGDDVTRVETAAEFRTAIGARRFDLILSDFKLIGFDGAAALREAINAWPDVPFLIVSGAMGETAAVDLLKSGATDVVLKDRLERLAPAVRRALREADARGARAVAEAALRESEMRLRRMVESVRDYAIFPMDVDGNVTGWNVGAERLFGYAEQEIVGRPAATLFTPEDRLADAAARELEAADAKGVSDDERAHQRRDGSRFHASSVVTPVRDAAGKLVGFTKVARDVTERRRHEDELERAREVAETASRAKDQFLAVLSHELRTPLTPVLAAAQMLERDREMPERLRDSLRLIRRNVELETRLIDDLLDLTRVSRGKMTLNLGVVDVHAKASHIVEMCRDEANDKGVRIDVDLHAASHHVRADAARVQQVVWNLLKNSVKFTPPGGRISLRSRSDPAGEHMTLEVSDTGIGIDAATLPRLFSAFEQGGANVTRLFGGLGLGLTISKAIVEMHRGTLSAKSEGVNRGATFTVELPTIAAPAARDASDDRAAELAACTDAAGQSVPCRVLLVEDNADTAGVMVMLLEAAGYSVRSADTVSAAVQAAIAETPDVLISDIGLPDGSGLDLMRQLKHRLPLLRGIALSGFGMEEDVRRSLAAGFTSHITKPVDIATLENAVRELAHQSSGEASTVA